MNPGRTPRTGGGPRVVVAGAGVLGLVCALRLAQGGARVTVYEAHPRRRNASAVAAGMIAPASEAWLDPPLRGLAGALRDAREAWSSLARELGVPLHTGGTRHVGARDRLAEQADLLQDLGFIVGAALDPAHGPVLDTPQDALIDPGPALDALRRRLVEAGGELLEGRVEPHGPGVVGVGGRPLEADAVVLAPGAPGRQCGLAPELDGLRPIKGQLLRYAPAVGSGPTGGPVLRAEHVYVVVQAGAVLAGATMEAGRDDLEPDARQAETLHRAAVALAPQLAGRSFEIAVGVRAETADGLPLAGPSRSPGVFLATGARRNGWLLAPAIGALVAAQVLGRPTGALAPLAERLHPKRFPHRDEATA